MTLSLLLLSCASPVAPGDDDAPAAVGDPTEWDHVEAWTEGEPLDVATVQATLTALLPTLPTYNAGDVITLYDAALARGDAGCPYREQTWEPVEEIASLYWYGDRCATADGVRFDGYAFERRVAGRRMENGGVFSGMDFKGDVIITDADGAVFALGGVAYLYRRTDRNSEVVHATSGVQGSVLWTGEALPDSWVRGPVLAELDLEAALRPLPYLWVNGSLVGLEGPVVAVSLEEVVATDEGCDELGGSVHLRDADGRWYDVRFDGPPWTGERGADCDGCAEVTLDGEVLGRVCLDPALLLGDGGVPW